MFYVHLLRAQIPKDSKIAHRALLKLTPVLIFYFEYDDNNFDVQNYESSMSSKSSMKNKFRLPPAERG